MNTIIFDIDGVIYSYPNINTNISPIVYSVYNLAKNSPLVKLIFLTGRSKYEKDETLELLNSLGITDTTKYELIMKPTKNENTFSYKSHQLNKLKQISSTICLFEDDRDIISYAQSKGISTLLVTP